MRRLCVLVVGIVCVAVAAPVAVGGGAQASRTAVKIGDNFYRPRSLTVAKGGTVAWRWDGRRRHDVYFTSGLRSGRPRRCGAQRHGKCSRRFKKAGRYGYVCTIHGSMTGKVVVRR
jgi:plastocyanin